MQTNYENTLNLEKELKKQIILEAKNNENTIKLSRASRKELMNYKNLKNTYNELEAKLTSAQLMIGMKDFNTRIIKKPTTPLKEDSTLINSAAWCLAILFCLINIAYGIIIRHLNRTIDNPQEVEDFLGVPVIGLIPNLSKNIDKKQTTSLKAQKLIDYKKEKETSINIVDNLIISEKNKSNQIITAKKESSSSSDLRKVFDPICTDIYDSATNSKSNIIQTVSSFRFEGRSTATSNLASIFANDGHKVLVIDADLHNPSLTKILGLKGSHYGLVDYLNNNCNYKQVIHKTHVNGLSSIPCGTRVVNSGMLLKSNRLEKLLNKLRNDFDYIFIDCPPLQLSNDALAVMNFADQILFILNAKVVYADLVKYSFLKLENNGHRPVKTIINNIEPDHKCFYVGDSKRA